MIGTMILTIGAMLFLIGYVWVGFDALKHDPGYGKWAFFSGLYRYNYCRANWNRTMFPCSATVLGMLMFLVGILL